MGWATGYITQLQAGTTVQVRPRGNSMQGKIESGQLCTIAPISSLANRATLEVGDIVLCRVKGKEFLHLISAIQDDKYQISNNKGFINGWISASQIFGRLVKLD